MKRLTAILIFLFACALAAAASAEKDEVTFDQHMLDVLRGQGAISESQYEELSRKARAEEEEQASRAEPPPAVSAPKDDPEGWKAYYKHGIRVERNDGLFTMRFGGRIHVDAAAVGADDAIEEAFDMRGTGVQFRRARLFVSGSFYEYGIFKAQYDFAGVDSGDEQETDFKDVWIGFRDLPYLGRFRVGHVKEAFALNRLTSSKYITFMERATVIEAFAPGRNTGLHANNTAFDERLTWHLGGYRDVDDSGSGFSNESRYNVTGRLTGLPYYADDGQRLVHLGLAYTHKFRSDTIRYTTRPESHLAERLVDTGLIPTDGVNQVGFEFVSLAGPVTFQTEFVPVWVDQRGGPSLDFWGAYAQLSWFITGEHRQYDTVLADFTRMKLPRRFSPKEGTWGAFELAGRYSYLDLSDENVRGGTENNVSVALNWHLYSNFRIMFSWIHAHLNGVGDSNIVQTRFALEF